jgi:hypothetical protein
MKLTDFLNSINKSKNDVMPHSENRLEEKLYTPFVINRCLSYHRDTLFLVNEMNVNHGLDDRMQYHFYLHGVRKRNRFSKWQKEAKYDDLEIVKQFFNLNTPRAEEYLSLLSNDDLQQIRKRSQTGGTKK